MATPPFKFASTHLGFSAQDTKKLHEPWFSIDSKEFAEEGLETDVHCTVRYGINDVNFTELYNEVSTHQKFPIYIHDIDMFDTKDGDCIYWKVVATGPLTELRATVEKIADCEPDKFPEYHPHITIAYVKKGLGSKIIERLRENIGIREKWSMCIEAESLIYASKEGKRHVIPFSHDTPKSIAESALIIMHQMNTINESIRNVRITVPSDKLSGWKAKKLSDNLEKVGGSYTRGKSSHIFKMPAKYGKTVFHKLWNTKLMKSEKNGPKVKYL